MADATWKIKTAARDDTENQSTLLIRKHIRPIYRQLGILPQIADGMQAAAALQVQQD